MSEQAREVLREHWGYSQFRACQEEIIDSVLAGRDTLGLMPTGGGKSITFQVPALLLPGITLVVTPLISLMKDQVDNLRQRGIKAIALHSGLTLRENNVALNHLEAGAIKILYVSPEKLQSDRFISLLRSLEISLIVVDEAHCISQWGYDFRPSYLKICDVRNVKPGVPVLALTASATPAVVEDITGLLKFKDRTNIYRLSFSRNNISYLVRNTENKEAKMIEVLSKVAGCGIVYVRSRRRTLELARVLQAAGISAEGYHAGLSPDIKNDRQNRWKQGVTRIIVATNAFGMGIDKPDVRIVIHYDIPPSLEEYYQEAGRAGRDGEESYAVLLVSAPDKGVLARRLSNAFPPREYVRDLYSKACVFLNIAMEEGYQTLHEFNFKLFVERYGLQAAQAQAALGLLQASGYLEYLEDYNSRSRVMVVVDRNQLYNTHMSPMVETVLRALLRNYTGLFADYEYISESVMAVRSSLTEQQVYESLLALAKMHIIHYVPRSNNPMMLLTASRIDGRHVLIPVTVYEKRRDGMKKRLDAMADFAFSDSNSCRTNKMLRYFGEEPQAPCGKCDWCRSRKSNHSLTTSSVVEIIHRLLDREPTIQATRLVTLTGKRDDIVIEELRHMADDGVIVYRDGVVYRVDPEG